ncbi:MAG: VTT domain-containing protein [Pseudomonadota bacterium]
MLDTAQSVMMENLWAVYLGILIAPFIQEDAAVIGATSLAASGMHNAAAVLAVALIGLSASDLWKYAIGALAQRSAWARRLAEGPRVKAAGDVVRERLGSAIFTARFIPGTRIALYIAAGYFRAPFQRFALFIVLSAALLIGALFGVLKVLGDLVGERAVLYVSLAAIAAVVVVIGIKVIAARRNPVTPA